MCYNEDIFTGESDKALIWHGRLNVLSRILEYCSRSYRLYGDISHSVSMDAATGNLNSLQQSRTGIAPRSLALSWIHGRRISMDDYGGCDASGNGGGTSGTRCTTVCKCWLPPECRLPVYVGPCRNLDVVVPRRQAFILKLVKDHMLFVASGLPPNCWIRVSTQLICTSV